MNDDNNKQKDQGTTNSSDDSGMNQEGYAGGEAVEDTDTGMDDTQASS